MRRIGLTMALLVALAAPAASADHGSQGGSESVPIADPLDAVIAAPASHHVVLENDRVRILSVRIAPGKTEPVHTHAWPSIMRVEAPQPLTYIAYELRDGKLVETGRKSQPLRSPAEAEWMEPEGPHAVENRGSSEYRALRIELKPDR